MMKIILAFIFCSQTAFASARLLMESASIESFSASIDQNDRQALHITNLKTNETENIRFAYSISDIKKMHIKTFSKKGKEISLELLLVVLSVGNREQSVQIFVPVRHEEIAIKGKLKPVCNLKNEGDFSWESGSDLQDLLKLVNGSGKNSFQIKLGRYDKNDKVKYSWAECFSF